MHLYIMTRGIKHKVDELINDLQAQFFPFKCKMKDGKLDPNGEEQIVPLQLSVRPIQLWELVMPKECLPEVMKTIWHTEPLPAHTTFMQKAKLESIRMALGAKKAPKFKDYKDLKFRVIRKNDVACYPIGIKEDDERSFGEGI